MRESVLLTEIRKIEDIIDESINELLEQVSKLKQKKENQTNKIKLKCINHVYNDKTTSLGIEFNRNKHYICRICNKEFPLEHTIENYLFRNKNIEYIPNEKLSENLKQLLDIIITDLKILCTYQGIYETFFENQCEKQGYYPIDIFGVLCEYNVFKVSDTHRGYIDIIR